MEASSKSMNERGVRVWLGAVVAGMGLALLATGLGAGGGEAGSPPSPHAPLTVEQRRARAEYWASKRGLQFGVPERAYAQALADAQALSANAAAGLAVPFSWSAIGPQPMLNNYPNFAGYFTGPPMTTSAGRVAAVAADPTTAKLIFIGAAGGGVWRSTDGGGTFAPVFDNEPTQAIGAITVDHHGIVWVGTGEGVQSDSYYGQGIFKSTDHGNTWTQITGGPGNPFIHAAFRRIAVDDSIPPHIFAAATYASSASRADASIIESDVNNDGLWRSTDGGATWIQVGNSTVNGGRRSFNGCTYFGATDPCSALDVVIDPNHGRRVYAAINLVNVFTSSDGGGTWSEAKFPGIKTGTTNEIGRAALAVTSAGVGAPATVYASVGKAGGDFYRGFFVSTDSGTTWAAKTIPSVVVGSGSNIAIIDGDGKKPGGSPCGDLCTGQSSYDQTVTVDPGDPQTVFFGGVGPYVSTDAGATWSFIAGSTSNTTVQVTHADQQASAIDPFNPNRLYLGNDGGFYAYDLVARSWTTFFDNQQNSTLNSGQIQGIGPHPTDNTRLLAGFQDNGTQLYTGTVGWQMVETGDGGFALFGSADPSFAYHTFATSGGPTPARSTDGGLTWNDDGPVNSLNKVIGKDIFGFYPPLAGDPSSGPRVMIGGHLIYVSTDGMLSWQVQSSNLTGSCTLNNGFCALQDIEFVPKTTRAWALSMQTSGVGFTVSNTTQANLNSGASWSDVTANLPFDSMQTQATGIAVDPNPGRSGVAYLSISGFTAATGIGHIYRSTDFGKSWELTDGSTGPAPLPDVPTLRILVDNTDPAGNTLLAGTDIGIFRSSDGGGTWSAFDLGVIPAVPVFDLEQNQNGVIFAGTHGRGAYQLSALLTATPTPVTSPTPAPTATATPGASVTSTSVSSTALPGANVAAGTVTITNTSSTAETVSSVNVTVSNPGIFSSLTLNGGGQSVTVTPASATTNFIFSPIGLAARASLTFSLSGVIAVNPVMLDSGIRYAGFTPGLTLADNGELPMGAGLLMIGMSLMAIPAARRRRIVFGAMLAIALAASQLGCGSSSNGVRILSSNQTVTEIMAKSTSGGAVAVSGLPAKLSTISVP
jgi:BNR-Asp box repeat